ncbi:MAG TPA: FAD-binding oxidoreductase [Blastocatellia bacterium]|jgi:glycolate oxidase FAD binding subunit
MIDRRKELSRLIQSVVGNEHVTPDPALSVDNLGPALLAKPGSAEEVAQCLGVCSKFNAAVVPGGLLTWLEGGNPVRRVDVVLSLERMSRILEYSPPDLTVTVEAGLSLSEFNSAAKGAGQWLPLDPPGFAAASLGAIAACGSSGALRGGFGTPRDYIIGLKLAHVDGTQSKSGGRVVKNVAGYDMNKLYVGSFGTLGVLTELTFKLRPLPECVLTLMITAADRESLVRLARQALASELQPASIFLTSRLGTGSPGVLAGDDALLIRFVESEAAVRHQADWIARSIVCGQRLAALDEVTAESVWKLVADLDLRGGNACKASVPLSETPALYQRFLKAIPNCVATADLATGIIRIAFDVGHESAIDLIRRLRGDAEAAGGTLFIERAAAVVRQHAGAWGEVGATASLMRSTKEKFDPQSLLNPGRFVAGI